MKIRPSTPVTSELEIPPVEIGVEVISAPSLEHTYELRDFKYWTWWLAVFALAWVVVFVSFFPDPAAQAQKNWPLIGIGFLGGVLGNATAVGGGLVFIPVIILFYQFPSVLALKIALASQALGMTSGAIGWMSKGAVPMKALLVAVPPMLLGSTISSLVIQPNALLVKGLFGPASIFIGLITLYLLDRHQGLDRIPSRAYLPLIAFSFVGGTLTGWIAIGQGEVIAAFLMLGYGLRAERGIGLGVVLLAIDSIYLTLIHQFTLDGIPWEIAIFTILGCVFGGRMGPYLSKWMGPRRLRIVFALIAVLDGTVILVQFLLTESIL